MDCGTPRVFEENDYKYVFRTRAHSTMDAVAGVRYILELKPETKSYSELIKITHLDMTHGRTGLLLRRFYRQMQKLILLKCQVWSWPIWS